MLLIALVSELNWYNGLFFRGLFFALGRFDTVTAVLALYTVSVLRFRPSNVYLLFGVFLEDKSN